MKFINHIISMTLMLGIHGCCMDPLLLNPPIQQRTYCSFKEVTGLNPNPENIRSWVGENDGTSYRLLVARRVLLHGMEPGSSTEKEEFAKVYLEIYRNLLSGIYGRDLKMAMISDDGRFIGIEQNRRFSVSGIAVIYNKSIIDNLSNCINENRNVSPYDWLSQKMNQ